MSRVRKPPSFLLVILLFFLNQAGRAETFFTRPYPYLFIHNMGGYGLYPWKQETLDYLSHFETIWVGNEYALPRAWADTLRGEGRRLLFYEFFPAVHFVFGIGQPQNYEVWKSSFVNNHKTEFWTINPLKPPGYTELAPGRYFSTTGALDYFINYGKREAEDFLIQHYYDEKRAAWGYSGIFFDLMGSAWMSGAQIQDPNNSSKWLNALTQYNMLASTHAVPGSSYDQNAAAFLARLRAKNPDTQDFPIWGNQAYLSGNADTGENEYYRVINADLFESTFTSWYNTSNGWKQGVRVKVDGVWHENANPVETQVTPFLTGAAGLQPMIKQAAYARDHYGNAVSGVVLNYVRPYYRPVDGGYEAVTDREAIYYSYAAGRVTGLLAYAFDYFDTVSNLAGAPGSPATTGLPLQPYFKWSQDPIYFLDLGEYADTGYTTLSLGGGRRAVLRFFEKGFIIINASSPAQDITVDLALQARLKGSEAGVAGYRDHFATTLLPSAQKTFTVPAAVYPLAGIKTNSARVYSYTRGDGRLIGSSAVESDWNMY